MIFTCTCCDNQSPVVAKCAKCRYYLCDNGLAKHRQSANLRTHKIVIFEVHAEEVNDVAIYLIYCLLWLLLLVRWAYWVVSFRFYIIISLKCSIIKFPGLYSLPVLFIYLFICLFVCLFIYLFIHLFIYLFVLVNSVTWVIRFWIAAFLQREKVLVNKILLIILIRNWYVTIHTKGSRKW